MTRLAAGTSYVDLEFDARPRIIATAVLQAPSGVALIDPGPASTLPTLRRKLDVQGIGIEDVTAILLTHIHLDHAGACGTLVAEHPQLRIYVHERGAPHMADPSKLVASASRLYGEENMARLWGEIGAVPESALVVLRGGERLEIAGARLDVAYTPGHASHHVSYFDGATGIAFVGDTAGIRLSDTGRVLPPTPPPDIDLEAWDRSLELIEARHPDTLFVTHFGAYGSPRVHIAELREHLGVMAGIARASLSRPGEDEDRERWFADEVRRDLRRHSGTASPDAYEAAGRLDLSWRGLARYWRKRLQA
jgi:glyoxylase-like metal-dependent hydrolase (beta-lactamase superfamily II)